MKTFSFFVAASIFVQTGSAMAVPLTLEVTQQTTFGESIFVIADHPLLGAQQIRRSVKMVPTAYPKWTVEVDLPAGIQSSVRFLIRNDSAGQLANGNNGTLLSATQSISTGETLAPAKRLAIWASPTATTAQAIVSSVAPGIPAVIVPLTRSFPASGGGQTLFTGEIDPVHVAEGRQMQLQIDGTSLFSAPRQLNPAFFEWRHGQAFLGRAPETAPTAARIETFSFSPANFSARTVRVYLPRGYNENTTKRYPVVYAQDGQNVFVPGGPFGTWALDTSATQMIRDGELPEFIIIGLDNGGSSRIQEYLPGWAVYNMLPGRGTEYLAMMRDELIPELRRRYRLAESPSDAFHIGSSMGGLIGFEAANHFENVWGTALIMSPAFWLNRSQTLVEAEAPPTARARVYLDTGIAGQSNDGFPDTVAVRDALLDSGHRIGRDFWFVAGYWVTGAAHEPGHEHNEPAWRDRSPNALRWAFIPQLEALAVPQDEALDVTSTLWQISGAE
jgi:predicted alpha/beta superfamily hydrolase